MKHNRYDKAVVLFKSAITYDDSNAAYHSWYGFSMGVFKTHLHEARDACKKAWKWNFTTPIITRISVLFITRPAKYG